MIRDIAIWSAVTLAGLVAFALLAFLFGRMYTSGRLMALKRWEERKKRDRGNGKGPNGGSHFPRRRVP